MTREKGKRVCNRCRAPQLVENLAEYVSGGRKRYRCIEDCKTVKTVAQPVIEPTEDGEEKIEISYKGQEKQVKEDRPHFITTAIVGERISRQFVKALETWYDETYGVVDIFLKLKYVGDDQEVNLTISQITTLFEGIDHEIHLSEDLLINNELEVLASANVHHNAVYPLNGVKSRAKTKYLIIPHARQDIDVTVNESWDKKSLLMSTGTISEVSKGHTQALGKTAFNSVIGGVIYNPSVYERYHLVPVNFSKDMGYFFNYDTEYHSNGEVKDAVIDTCYLSDLHASLIDEEYLDIMLEDLAILKPKQTISGDVMDLQSLNYHEANSVFYHSTRMSFVHELEVTRDIVVSLQQAAGGKFIPLSSNHENFFHKYLQKPSNLKSLNNEDLAEVFRTLAYLADHTYLKTEGIVYGNVMEYWFGDLENVTFTPDESLGTHLRSHGNEYGLGLRLSNVSNIKAILGHTHYSKQHGGITYVGSCMVEKPSYQNGMNASTQSMALLGANNKRQLLVRL